MNKLLNIAIFASGTGSNALNIINYFKEHSPENSQIKLVFSDQKEAAVLEKASQQGIECFCIPNENLNKYAYERKILDLMSSWQIDWIFLAGYMKILSARFLQNYKSAKGFNRVVNIHPSLLPKYKGLNAYEQAFKNKDQTYGATIHLVDELVDNGPIILQRSISNSKNLQFDEFKERGLKNEHELYRKFCKLFTTKKLSYQDNKIIWE